jgi:hypothetical protein
MEGRRGKERKGEEVGGLVDEDVKEGKSRSRALVVRES